MHYETHQYHCVTRLHVMKYKLWKGTLNSLRLNCERASKQHCPMQCLPLICLHNQYHVMQPPEGEREKIKKE